jgi:hypothetical protein
MLLAVVAVAALVNVAAFELLSLASNHVEHPVGEAATAGGGT